MINETERSLRLLFSETPCEPVDEAFVAQIVGRVARRCRFRNMALAGGGLVCLALLTALFPVGALVYVSQIPAELAGPMEAFLVSPAGWVLSVLIGVGAAVRATVWTSD